MTTTTDPAKIEQVVFDALEEFGAEKADINRDATFEVLDVDSLDLVELAQVVEDEFGVKIKSSDVEQLKTVGDVLELIAARS
ncbi:MAG TPA: acyl carrier protein [Solirubrobacteraceae bacterium]|jgi:acyl carrier protein